MAQPTGWGALLRVLDTILPSAAGALVSLRFVPGTPVQRVASLLLGVVCAHYLGNGVIGLWQVPAGLVSDAVKFIAGVFGLTIVGYAYGELPALRRLVHDWLQQAAQRWTGGRKE